jgi:hypothetical protein
VLLELLKHGPEVIVRMKNEGIDLEQADNTINNNPLVYKDSSLEVYKNEDSSQSGKEDVKSESDEGSLKPK